MCLNFAAWTRSQVAHLHHQTRALHGVELEDEWSDFSYKRISRESSDLVLARTSISAEQVRNRDLQRGGQACERRQRGCRFLVLDLRNVCARHLHAASELALAQARATT